MGRIWLPGGGGGGASSDDCTLMRAAVPAGMKAVTADSDDEAMEGTLNPDTTLADSQALSGQTFLKWNPQTKLFEKRTGSMANRGAVNQSLAINGSYTIPAGYHNGSGKVTQSIPTQGGSTTTPGTANKTIVAANRYVSGNINVAGDPNLIAANIVKGKTIFGVPGSAEEYKSPAAVSPLGAITFKTNSNFSGGFAGGYFILNASDTDVGYIIARLNNNQGVNLSGWNYLNLTATLNKYNIGYAKATAFVGFSKNSNLTALSFDVSWSKSLIGNEETIAIKLNVSNLNGIYFLYAAIRTDAGYDSNRRNSLSGEDITLSTQ